MNDSSKMQRSAPRTGYIPTLDGWRAVAIALVLINHAPNFPVGQVMSRINGYGAMGVDLFFAISGILICARLIQEEQASGRISLLRFYRRRTLRIFPPLYLFLAVIAVLALRKVLPSSWSAWWTAVLFVRNYYGSFAMDGFRSRMTGHFWSLAVEEHFYLILPAVLILFRRHRKAALAILAVAAYARMSLYILMTPPTAREILWERRTDLRLQCLLFPALIALFLVEGRSRAWLERNITLKRIGIFFVLLLCAGTIRHFTHTIPPPSIAQPDPANPGNFIAPPETQVAPFPIFIAPVFFPFLLVATILHPHSWMSRILELRPLRAIGRISYSLYIWQQLFWVSMSYRHWPIRHVQQPLVGFILSFACAITSYYVVEKPAIRLGHRLFPPATPGHANLETRPAVASVETPAHSTVA